MKKYFLYLQAALLFYVKHIKLYCIVIRFGWSNMAALADPYVATRSRNLHKEFYNPQAKRL